MDIDGKERDTPPAEEKKGKANEKAYMIFTNDLARVEV
jgi:hypothetical protein